MPELPDVVLYLEALERQLAGHALRRIDVRGISLLRSYDPPLEAFADQPVVGLRRLGKRLVFEFPDELFLVLHLMIAGRLHWKKVDAAIPGKVGLAAFRFDHGTLTLTEAASTECSPNPSGAWGLLGATRQGHSSLGDAWRSGIGPILQSAPAHMDGLCGVEGLR